MSTSFGQREDQDFLVDMVVAVHTVKRPIGRAVESLLEGGIAVGPGGLRVTVVCHNIAAEAIADQVPSHLRAVVRFLELNDGIASPAGPLNHGLAQATARYVGVIGSDDSVEPGAIAGWLATAEKYSSAAVIARERHADGRKVRTPVLRVGRSHNLHPVKDRLSYRTAPLGLIRRSELERLNLRFTPGFPTGDDQEFSSKLWFGGGRIDYARRAGRYVVGADADDRVTLVRRPVPVELGFLVALVRSEWFRGQGDVEKGAIIVKLVRVHVFSLVQNRFESGGWSAEDRAEASAVLKELLMHAPHALMPLSPADQRLVGAVLDTSVPSKELRRYAMARRQFGRIDTLLPGSLRAALNPESPLRFMPAAALLR